MSERKGLPRWLWEFLVLALIGAAGYGAWWWLGIQHGGDLQEQKDQLTREHQTELQEAQAAVAAALSSEATAAAVAFRAGIQSLAVDGRWAEVDAAALELLELPGVAFVHILAGDGTVKVSSDRKMLATGQAGPRAKWALEADGVVQRTTQRQTLEIATPLGDFDGGVEAGEPAEKLVLWLGYRSPLG
ncbi:MAG: hypothetical protein AAGF23_10190 [Acidobacteriota bacterium]